jgi:hypothetical protein
MQKRIRPLRGLASPSYSELEPWYRADEAELGVTGELSEQRHFGITFPDDYPVPDAPPLSPWPRPAGV